MSKQKEYLIETVPYQNTEVRWDNEDDYREYSDIERLEHYVGATTAAFRDELTALERVTVFKLFNEVSFGDSFYSFRVHRKDTGEKIRVFINYNGECGYTAMLAEDY